MHRVLSFPDSEDPSLIIRIFLALCGTSTIHHYCSVQWTSLSAVTGCCMLEGYLGKIARGFYNADHDMWAGSVVLSLRMFFNKI